MIVSAKPTFCKDFTQWLGTYRIDQVHKEQHSQAHGALFTGFKLELTSLQDPQRKH